MNQAQWIHWSTFLKRENYQHTEDNQTTQWESFAAKPTGYTQRRRVPSVCSFNSCCKNNPVSSYGKKIQEVYSCILIRLKIYLICNRETGWQTYKKLISFRSTTVGYVGEAWLSSSEILYLWISSHSHSVSSACFSVHYATEVGVFLNDVFVRRLIVNAWIILRMLL